MGWYKDNALFLRASGSGYVTTVKSKEEIEMFIGDAYLHTQMIRFGSYPIAFESLDKDPTGASCSPTEASIINFIRQACIRGQGLPPADPMDYDFHRITNPEQVQMFVHDEGALPHENRPFNMWWKYSYETRGIHPLFGNCVILGQCIDELTLAEE